MSFLLLWLICYSHVPAKRLTFEPILPRILVQLMVVVVFSSLTWIFFLLLFLPTDIGSLTFEPILPFLSSSNWLYKEFIKEIFVSWNFLFEKFFFKLSCVCLSLEKLVNEKYFPVKGKFDLVSRKSIFLKNLSGKHFLKVEKNLEMLYYLLIISNLVLKLLIAIYILF